MNDDSALWRHAHLISAFFFFLTIFKILAVLTMVCFVNGKWEIRWAYATAAELQEHPSADVLPTTELEDQMGNLAHLMFLILACMPI